MADDLTEERLWQLTEIRRLEYTYDVFPAEIWQQIKLLAAGSLKPTAEDLRWFRDPANYWSRERRERG